jgi:hypothetical protein
LAAAVTFARPLASVTAESALNVALAPDDGALNPIVAPGSGALAKSSVNWATSGTLNGWLTSVL